MTRMLRRFLRQRPLGFMGGLIVLAFVFTGVMAPVLAPKDPNQVAVRYALEPPGAEFPLGADNNGRDMLSRIIFGARVSLLISVTSVSLATILGVALGVIAAWFRPVRAVVMRSMDLMLAFPGIIVALVIIAILGKGLENLILAIAIYQIPQFGRLSHGLALATQEQQFVEAALAAGSRTSRVIGRHIVPNILGPILVQVSLMLPSAIMTAASLSFVGLGVQPPTAEWGAMLQASVTWSSLAPHLAVYPGMALMLVVLGFNILGDSLRDFLDPKTRK